MQKTEDPQCKEQKQDRNCMPCQFLGYPKMSNSMGRKKIHYPPPQASQIFELLELRRRLKALYRRQQDKIVLLVEKGGEPIVLNQACES